MQPFRVPSALGPESMKTYRILSPVSTHHRPASCAEVGCGAWAGGWTTRVDVSTELGAAQARYIRERAGRAFSFTETPPLVEFVFPAGQECFARHTVPLERPETYLVHGGDWRGDPRGDGIRQHVNAEDWVDDFANHQDSIAKLIERG